MHLDNHPSIHPSLHISSFSSFSTSLFSVHSAIHASIGSCFNPLICSFICSGIPAFTCHMYTVIPCLLFLANSILTIVDCKSKLHQAHISKTNQIKQWQSWGIDQSNLKGQLAWEWVLHYEKPDVLEVTVYTPLLSFSVWTCSCYLVLLRILAIVGSLMSLCPI